MTLASSETTIFIEAIQPLAVRVQPVTAPPRKNPPEGANEIPPGQLESFDARLLSGRPSRPATRERARPRLPSLGWQLESDEELGKKSMKRRRKGRRSTQAR